MSKQEEPAAPEESAESFIIIRLKVHKGNGKAIIVDDAGVELPLAALTPAKQKEIYDSPNGFRVVGTLYHAHMSPACLYWNGSQPIIIPC